MGKAYKRTGPPAALQQAGRLPQSAPEAQQPDVLQPIRVDLGDTGAIKRALDDIAAQAVLNSGFREDFTISNLKIGLGLFTCSWALVAHFYPKRYPQNPHNWLVLVLCLAAYAVCTAALNGLMWFVERDTFLFTHRTQGQAGGAVLSLSSSMPKFQDVYTLQLQSRDQLFTTRPRTVAQLEKSVTAYFDEEGTLLEDVYRRDVQRVVQQFTSLEAKKQR